ncbi:DUF357 domain-containing protein [candidate division KSB1 bacterium]
MDKITKEGLNKYFDITGRAIEKVKIVEHLELSSESLRKFAHVFLDMAKRYYSDAKHFADKGDMVTAFAALNYAHGWLDAGARMGIFDVGGDSTLFTVDEK